MDQQVFQVLYETHYKALLHYLLSLCGNRYDAEDLAHEAFLKYEKGLPSFRKDCSDYTMLCTIARNLFLNRKRKDARIAPLEEDLPEQGSMEEQLSDKEQARQIHEILLELPDPYKEVFMLKVFGELDFKTIAKLFGKSESWAKMTYYRAKARIIDKLEGAK
ncbi:MAG: sigma-70 family RNA polymerase sigma factor [Firmicutes bacterium]|nr:sigma-70 family RNA polymerase sigma factor [Bacillota bacterium]